MFGVVAFFTNNHFVIITGKAECGGQLQIAEGPAAPAIIEVAFTGLEVDSNVAFFFEANYGGVGVSSADVGETANMGNDFVKYIGAFPGNGEGANTAGADAADAAAFGIVGKVVGLANFGEYFFDNESGVGIGEGVVFHRAVTACFLAFFFQGEFAGVDEDADGDGHFAFVDEIVEYGGGTKVAGEADIAAAILEDHDTGGSLGVILSGDIEPIVAGGAFIDFAGGELMLCDGALGDSILNKGIGDLRHALSTPPDNAIITLFLSANHSTRLFNSLIIAPLFFQFLFSKIIQHL